MLNKAMYSSASDEWETPQDLFDDLDVRFHFQTDVCATPQNAKCQRFFTKEQNGLLQDWGGDLLDESAIRARNWSMDAESL